MKYPFVLPITFISTIIAIGSFNWQYGTETFIFFGFAENKELEIRLEHPSSIENIYVTPGKKVHKGELLMEVTRSSLELTQSDLSHEIAKLESQVHLWESSLKSNIQQLLGQKTAIENEIQSKIDQLESDLSIKESLIKDLESIKPAQDKTGRSPNIIKIEGLKKELRLNVRPLNTQIRELKNELRNKNNPTKIQIEKLTTELGFVNKEEEKLSIFAPNDGVIGSIFCKVGEQISAYTTLVTFYQENPTEVKGYVLESLILNVKIGDTITVLSGVTSDSKCIGMVTGMGSRIIEIPERLRKNPVFKTYGREIQIQIPADNNFLQKEKVILRSDDVKIKSKNSFMSKSITTANISPGVLSSKISPEDKN
jgi:multidrug resistance efflux pump